MECVAWCVCGAETDYYYSFYIQPAEWNVWRGVCAEQRQTTITPCIYNLLSGMCGVVWAEQRQTTIRLSIYNLLHMQ